MLAIVLLSNLLAAPATDSSENDPKLEAAVYAAAAEDHLRRAASPGAQQLDEFEGAHKNFDLAFLTADDAQHLCRALLAAELALSTAHFSEDQARMSWEEVRRDDLDRLRKRATATGVANCRYDATGTPLRPRVAVLDDADFPPAAASPSLRVEDERPRLDLSGPTPVSRRRWQARTAAGAVLTGAGVGLAGVVAAMIGIRVRQAEELRDIFDNARATRDLSDPDRSLADAIKADSIRTRNVAIGAGVAGAASLATGIALLVTRKSASRGVALVPYGGPLGGGAVLRLRF
jgi:hypothetical protein